MSRTALRLGLVAASCLAALAVAEVGLRIAKPEIGWRPFRDDFIGWSHKEYQNFEPDPRPPGGGGKPRILTLGDSFLAGSQLKRLDHRFPAVLQQALSDRVRCQVFATGGWGTDQQLFAFRQKGAPWQPDVVIVAFCANNDLANILSNSHGPDTLKPYFVLGDDGQLSLFDTYGTPLEADAEAGGARVGTPPQSYLLDYLRAHLLGTAGSRAADDADDDPEFAAVDPRYRLWRGRDPELPESIFELAPKLDWSPQLGVNSVTAYVHEDFPLNRYAWDLLEAILGQMRADVEAAGGELIMMLLPVTFRPQDARFIAGADFEHRFDTPDGPFTFRAAEPRDRLAAICARQGVRFFDPTVQFIPYVVENDLLLECWPDPANRHFAERAHFILGQLLAKYLRAEGLLRP